MTEVVKKMSVLLIVLVLFGGYSVFAKPDAALVSVDAYIHCYQLFTDRFSVYSSYHELCLIRDKLNVCKQKVTAAFPHAKDLVVLNISGVDEFIAQFWCTYNPVTFMPHIPIEALFYKYNHCPNVSPWFMALPPDYSASERLFYGRALFSYVAMKSISIAHLTKWQPSSTYNDPTDPVYQALSSFYCAMHYHTKYRAHIVDKYCIEGSIYRDLSEKVARYLHLHMDGLTNWDSTMCQQDPVDPMERMLKVGDLKLWLKLQINSSLDQCHADNVAVRGGSCVVLHHMRVPPYTDIPLFMQGFCKPIGELSQCWEEVAQMCPKRSMKSDMDVLIQLHQSACELYSLNSTFVWEVIYKWSAAFRRVKGSQSIMQELFYKMNFHGNLALPDTTARPLPYASSLNATLSAEAHIAPKIRSLLEQVVSHLERITIVDTYRFQGINLLQQMHAINHGIANSITAALSGPVELFLTIAGFIEYDPKNFKQWTFMY